jgi:ACS family glucarate transporter-like MFS transporter
MNTPIDKRPAPSSAPVNRPTRVRYMVVVFGVLLAAITYVDRVCLFKSAPYIMKDLDLSEKQWGWVLAAFTGAYALFEIPGGWMGDRWGARKVLMRVVIWWSCFTILTGRVFSFAVLVASQLLFGAGEAGAFPNITKAFATWLPTHDRVRAQSILWLSARWGGAFTPIMVVWLLNYLHWRSVFTVFGLVGIVWAVCFFFWYRDNPRDNPSVNEAELALIPPASSQIAHGPVPWKKLVTTRSVWLLWAQYMCLGYGWFYVTWLPKYLSERQRSEERRVGKECKA